MVRYIAVILKKAKLSLWLIKHQDIKTYRGEEMQLHTFLIDTDGGGWPASRPVVLSPCSKIQYSLYKRLGTPPYRSGHSFREEKAR
jgi:hypothetical protein